MISYFKLGKVRGLSIEINSDFGVKPVYKRTRHHCEIVVDMPYTQIIYTSGAWAPMKHTSEDVANDDTCTGKEAKQI